MCGRYHLSRRKEMSQDYFETANEVDWEPRYNVAPSQATLCAPHPRGGLLGSDRRRRQVQTSNRSRNHPV
jgi:putative SOS response-associated peptidase YedK